MLYAILKPIVKAALRLYFGRIECSGLDQIDRGGPMILLANHTASFMDAILVATFLKRRIHFFARGDVFRHWLADYLLRSLGMMPVYRLSEGRENLHLNDDSNDEAMEILAGGGAVLIFAEGVSDIAKVLKQLKKGPFRLAAGAAGVLPQAPLLLPLGINYTTPTQPFGDVFLNAGKPIESASIMLSANGNGVRAATEMMRATAAALRPLVWHVERREDAPLAEGLLGLLGEEVQNYTFGQSRRLFRYINETADSSLRPDWHDYVRWQRGYPLRSRAYDAVPSKWQQAAFLAGLPIAVAGFGWNFLPLAAARSLANRKVKAPDFWAPVFVAIAIVLTLLWWAAMLAAGIRSGHCIRTALLLAAGAACGVFYLKVYRPIARKALAPLQRAAYRRLNTSYASMERYRQLLKERVRSIATCED